MSAMRLRAYSRWIHNRKTPSDLQWLRLERRNSLAWAMWPAAIQRLANFHTRYQPETNAITMIDAFSVQFAAGTPQSCIWVVTTQSGDIVAHCATSVEKREIGNVAFVWQIECDVAIPRPLMRAVLRDVEVWSSTRGCAYIEMWTEHDPAVWERVHNFRRHRTIMRRIITTTASSEDVVATVNVPLSMNGNVHE